MIEAIAVILLLIPILWIIIVSTKRPNPLPAFIVRDSVAVTEYDGCTLRDSRPDDTPPFPGYPDDLLTGGLNTAGLQNNTPPGFADPLNPTATELRRLALYTNYRAIVDTVEGGGFGTFWGPKLAPDFGPEIAHGLIPGVEYTALMKNPEKSPHINRVPVAVLIPDHFDTKNPCIFLAPQSGSRGYYGGIAVGEWGLLKGCAVVLPGKGTGTGFHHLSTDEVYASDGRLLSRKSAAGLAQFALGKSKRLKEFVTAHPHRVAVKHAHSEINCEHLWGDLVQDAVQFAFWALNNWFSQVAAPVSESIQNAARPNYSRPNKKFTQANTLVIASGTSNGGAASLRAVEKDTNGVIHGAVVIEPNISPDSAGKFEIQFGRQRFSGHGTSLFANTTLMGLYAPCAALGHALAQTPCNLDPIGAPPGAREKRCRALFEKGLLQTQTVKEQAEEALALLRAHGYYQEQEILLAGHEWLNLWRSLNPTYASAYGRFAVWENLGGISFAAVDPKSGRPVALAKHESAVLFATGNGIPPSNRINLINDAAANGPILENLSISPTTNLADLNLEGALYFRYLATGNAELLPNGPTTEDLANHARVQKGIKETLADGNLHGTPTLVLAGRSDALIWPNHHSRPYYGLNQMVEGEKSRLSYIEVTNAQHFDAMISNLWRDPATQAVQFVPLHYYLNQALDWMYAYLTQKKTALPPSQVVRAQPRGSRSYVKAHRGSDLLPDIRSEPAVEDRITFNANILNIPL